MFQDVTIEELNSLQQKKNVVLIDVRSPSEYREATVPGSINIPFFDDQERAEIGTLYKQVSVEAAKERGLEIVSAKLPRFVKEFSKIKEEKVVFCWRGGMRSRTSATVLSLMGIKAYRLHGGYRSHRNWVVDTLHDIDFKPEAYVINGNTGSGKTLLLRRLKEEGYPVMDLEGLANHRGSIFGQIGLQPHNQKYFESLILQDILEMQDSPYILMEAESKRVGKVVLPEFITEKKENGIQFFIDLPIEERVRHIIDDYQPWNHKKESIDAFQKIKRRIHTPIAAKIESDLQTENFSSAIQLLLEHYYDPRYEYTAQKFPEDRRILIKVNTIDEAIQQIRSKLNIMQKQ